MSWWLPCGLLEILPFLTPGCGGQLYFKLSPLQPPSSVFGPNFKLVLCATPTASPWHLAWRWGWQTLRPTAAQGRPRHSPQLPARAAGQAHSTGSRGHWAPLLPHCPAKASPAGVKLIRRVCGERVRPPGPRVSSSAPTLQLCPASLTFASCPQHQPSHRALASTAK